MESDIEWDDDPTNSNLVFGFEIFDNVTGTLKTVTDISSYSILDPNIFMFEIGDIVSSDHEHFTNGTIYSRSVETYGPIDLRFYVVGFGGASAWIPELSLRKEGHKESVLVQPSSQGWWDTIGQWLGFTSAADFDLITKDLYDVQSALVIEKEKKTVVDQVLARKSYELDRNLKLAAVVTASLLALFFLE